MTEKIISVPISNPKSALDGYSLMAIDTDPDSNLALSLSNFRRLGIEIKSVIPTKFNEYTDGYILVTYDKKLIKE